MTAARTLRDITTAEFDAVLGPVPQPRTEPVTNRARVELDGETYSLTRVVMPDGELRRFATQYNGYGENVDRTPEDRRRSMQFACAWTSVAVVADDPEPITLTEDGDAVDDTGHAATAIARITDQSVRADTYTAALRALKGRSDLERLFLTAYRVERTRIVDAERAAILTANTATTV